MATDRDCRCDVLRALELEEELENNGYCPSCGAEIEPGACCLSSECYVGRENAWLAKGDYLYHWQRDGEGNG